MTYFLLRKKIFLLIVNPTFSSGIVSYHISKEPPQSDEMSCCVKGDAEGHLQAIILQLQL